MKVVHSPLTKHSMDIIYTFFSIKWIFNKQRRRISNNWSGLFTLFLQLPIGTGPILSPDPRPHFSVLWEPVLYLTLKTGKRDSIIVAGLFSDAWCKVREECRQSSAVQASKWPSPCWKVADHKFTNWFLFSLCWCDVFRTVGGLQWRLEPEGRGRRSSDLWWQNYRKSSLWRPRQGSWEVWVIK